MHIYNSIDIIKIVWLILGTWLDKILMLYIILWYIRQKEICRNILLYESSSKEILREFIPRVLTIFFSYSTSPAHQNDLSHHNEFHVGHQRLWCRRRHHICIISPYHRRVNVIEKKSFVEKDIEWVYILYTQNTYYDIPL